jgi:hypothetical protein
MAPLKQSQALETILNPLMSLKRMRRPKRGMRESKKVKETGNFRQPLSAITN